MVTGIGIGIEMIYLINGNALHIPLANESVQCVITSPPYWSLRDYRVNGQLGLEKTPEEYVANMVAVFREVWRVLRSDGIVFLNLGDSYAGSGQGWQKENGSSLPRKWLDDYGYDRPPGYISSKQSNGLKPKDLIGIPWRTAFALQAEGWWLRSAITWIKGNPMPESVSDRPTKATEMIFLLTKSSRYFWDANAVRGFSKSLNPSNAVDKKLVFPQFSTSTSFASECGDVTSYSQLAPYFILACLLAMKSVSVKKGDDNFHQILGILQSPMANRARLLARQEIPENTAKFLLDVLQNWEVIISELDLNAEPKFWIGFGTALTKSIVSIKATLSVEKASEVVSKLISNMKILRQTFTLDAILKGSIDVNFVNQPVAFLDCSEALSGDVSDGLVTVSTLKKLNFLISNILGNLRTIDITHNVNSFPGNYTTQEPSSGRNILDWWYINTEPFPESHFAVFPTKLVEPCLLAGTSAKGCCPKCGKGWRRIVNKEKDNRPFRDGSNTKAQNAGIERRLGANGWNLPSMNYLTLGWQPACSCNAGDPIPCTVLDPFAGTATVGLVARKHNRRFVGIELKAEYIQLARKRTAEIQPVIGLEI